MKVKNADEHRFQSFDAPESGERPFDGTAVQDASQAGACG